jgi:hypothetical protein
MNDFFLFVWRCTIGPVLLLLLLLCGAVSFLFGGRRFLNGCMMMARHAGMYYAGDATPYYGLYDIRRHYMPEPERTNPLSALLWNVLFGVWLQILFLVLAALCHFLLPWRFGFHMLSLAHGVRNPAYFIECSNGVVCL